MLPLWGTFNSSVFSYLPLKLDRIVEIVIFISISRGDSRGIREGNRKHEVPGLTSEWQQGWNVGITNYFFMYESIHVPSFFP